LYNRAAFIGIVWPDGSVLTRLFSAEIVFHGNPFMKTPDSFARSMVCALVLLMSCFVVPVMAHPEQGSEVLVRQDEQEMVLTIRWPLSELQTAAPEIVISAEKPDAQQMKNLEFYLTSHVRLFRNGQSLPLQLTDIFVDDGSIEDDQDQVLQLTVHAALDRVLSGELVLEYDAIDHVVNSHKVRIMALHEGEGLKIVSLAYPQARVNLDSMTLLAWQP
jgi:hypothetical protein